MRGAERALGVPREERVRLHVGDGAVLALRAELARGRRERRADGDRAVAVLGDREPVSAPLAVLREVADVRVYLIRRRIDRDLLLVGLHRVPPSRGRRPPGTER